VRKRSNNGRILITFLSLLMHSDLVGGGGMICRISYMYELVAEVEG
jgi:hypothetical protein